MATNKASRLFDWVDQHEYLLCQTINRWLRFRALRQYFSLVSKLGNGGFWYATILALPLFSPEVGLSLALLCTLTGLCCTLIYKVLKQSMVRERPFIAFPTISCGLPPLDRYSFPSGHTLHAVCFNLLIYTELSLLGLMRLPFTLSVMASRVILGLHYPSDVAVGAVIGASLALVSSGLVYPWLLATVG